MPAEFALSWDRNEAWADKLHKPVGRAISPYHAKRFEDVEGWANHINAINPLMRCAVEVFT